MASKGFEWTRGIALPLCALFLALAINTGAQAESLSTAEASYTTSESTSPETESIVLARPIYDTVPNFLNELDTYLMSDELVDQIEDKYALRLREFSLKQGFMFHTRDNKIQRSFLGTSEEEKALHTEMANSIKRYMLVRGIPKYLSARKATRFIGQTYTGAVSLAQKATRIEFKGEDQSWKFGTGVNPFTTKAWAKYSNKSSTVELYNHFDKDKSLGLVALTHYGYYQPKMTYYIQRNAFEMGFRYSTNPQWEVEYRTYYPLEFDVMENMISYVSTTYRF